MPSRPPTIPPDLLERFGEPEHSFGPNMRFRTQSVLLGTFLFLLGLAFLIVGLLERNGQQVGLGGGGGGVLIVLASGLLAIGGVAIYLPFYLPRDWLFVCARGLVRYLNRDWVTLDWSDALRFEDVSLPQVRQCQIVTADGSKWGFIADLIADYKRLTEVLGEKMKAKAATGE